MLYNNSSGSVECFRGKVPGKVFPLTNLFLTQESGQFRMFKSEIYYQDRCLHGTHFKISVGTMVPISTSVLSCKMMSSRAHCSKLMGSKTTMEPMQTETLLYTNASFYLRRCTYVVDGYGQTDSSYHDCTLHTCKLCYSGY